MSNQIIASPETLRLRISSSSDDAENNKEVANEDDTADNPRNTPDIDHINVTDNSNTELPSSGRYNSVEPSKFDASVTSGLLTITNMSDLLDEVNEIRIDAVQGVKQASIAKANVVVRIGRLAALGERDVTVAELIRKAASENGIRTRSGDTKLFHIIAKLVFGVDARTASSFSVAHDKAKAAGVALEDLSDFILKSGGVDSLARTKKRGKADAGSSRSGGVQTTSSSTSAPLPAKSVGIDVAMNTSVSEPYSGNDGTTHLSPLEINFSGGGDLTIAISAADGRVLAEGGVSAEQWIDIKRHGLVIEVRCGEHSLKIGPIALSFQTPPLTEADILDA